MIRHDPEYLVFFLEIEEHKKTRFKKLDTGSDFWAENVGFEPTVPCGTTVFKTAAIDHSANSPGQK